MWVSKLQLPRLGSPWVMSFALFSSSHMGVGTGTPRSDVLHRCCFFLQMEGKPPPPPAKKVSTRFIATPALWRWPGTKPMPLRSACTSCPCGSCLIAPLHWLTSFPHLPASLAPANKPLELKFLAPGLLPREPKLRQSSSLATSQTLVSHISVLLSPDSAVLFPRCDFTVCLPVVLLQSLCRIKGSGTDF